MSKVRKKITRAILETGYMSLFELYHGSPDRASEQDIEAQKSAAVACDPDRTGNGKTGPFLHQFWRGILTRIGSELNE